MVRLEKPMDVSAGILGRIRTLPIRSARPSSRLTQRSLTVSIAARNRRNGSSGGEPSINSGAKQLRVATTYRFQPEQEPLDQQALSQSQPAPSCPQQKSRPPSLYSITTGASSGLMGRFRRFNSGVSNSANSAVDGDDSLQLPDGWRYGRRSLAMTRRQGKSVSITSARESRTRDEIDKSAGASGGYSTQNQPDPHATRSIIKLRRLSDEQPLLSLHNLDTAGGKGDGSPTLHQQREQKIFDKCRFIPTDTFYKKVLIAPNQDKQFFASPKCNRIPGSNMLYDIANQNPMHHRDVNFDFMRDTLRKTCSTFYRTSQFRHPGY